MSSRAVGMMTINGSFLGPFLILHLLSASVSSLGSVLVKNFTANRNHYSWQEARSFCRSSDTALAVISTPSDANGLSLQNYHAWFGLHKQTTPGNHYYWAWPNQEHWHSWTNNPQNSNDACAYVCYIEKSFYSNDCEEYYFFICDKDGDEKYIFINQSKTWADAQRHCKELYHDLAVIKDQGQLNSAVKQQDFPVWTGLHRDGATGKWSTGLLNYSNWAPNEPGNSGDCVTISSLSKTLSTQNCSARYPFICVEDNLVLVKENKTWEEALQYCKTFTNPNNKSYQLVSVQPGDDFNYMMVKVMEADTDEVWTGLRFMAGNWVWVNGADMTFSDLPACPVPQQHCGAFSKKNTGTLATRGCLDKKNFLCYGPP